MGEIGDEKNSEMMRNKQPTQHPIRAMYSTPPSNTWWVS